MRSAVRLALGSAWLIGVAFAAEEAPSWLRDAAAAPKGAYAAKVPAVALLDEEQITVDETGRTLRRYRYAMRILNREGREHAVARCYYDTSGSRVREFHAWMLGPGGAVIRYGKDRILDVAANRNDVYNEIRAREVVAESDAQDGSVFGYEYLEEENSVFTQFEWGFQSRLPVLLSRFSLTLPGGWTAQSVTFNHASVAPTVNGSSYSWELRDLPYIEREPHSPSIAALAPRLAVSYLPPPGNPAGLRGMTDWAAVSGWLAELQDSQAQLDEVIAHRATELASAATSELGKIEAIARFVQDVNYVEISTKLRRGGGMKPHLARQVFDKEYGDCKDKANLMRTMLKALGIPSYMMSIWATDRSYVRPEWPSPDQFNHAIIAIKVGDATQSPAIAMHPQVGRLLFFDPTDPYTPVGDLPIREQGSYALVNGAEREPLVKMPFLPASANRIETTIGARLSDRGAVAAEGEMRHFGQAAARMRRMVQSSTASDLRLAVERRLAQSLGGAKLVSLAPVDSRQEGRLDLRLEFSADSFAQSMQGRLLVLKPGTLVFSAGYNLPAIQRTLPLVLDPELRQDKVTVQLPASFKVDEMPDPVKLATPFGQYEANWTLDGADLVFTEALEVHAITAPPADYPAARAFFESVAGAEQAPVVLIRR
ncbi:MAG: DUF3857 domain-containing transglutaminase family protein [Bryobacteraceae bacterium]